MKESFFDPKATLDVCAIIHRKLESMRRYKTNPHVHGDTVASHLSRLIRLISYCLPVLEAEFPDHPNLGRDMFLTAIWHDDGELDAEISTFAKEHGGRQHADEFNTVAMATKNLNHDQIKMILHYIKDFQEQTKSLPARLVKVFDNIVGNALALEQKTALIQPDYAAMCINYVEHVRGVSQVTDALIDIQVQQITAIRDELVKRPKIELIQELFTNMYPELLQKIQLQLDVDIKTFAGNKTKAYVPVWKYTQ